MVKALLIAAFVLVCLAVVAMTYIVPNIHIQEQKTAQGDRVRVDTPFGSVHVNEQKHEPVDLGNIPIYPGAERAKGSGGAVIGFDWGKDEKQFAVSGAEFTSQDSESKVREWYRDQLPDWHIVKGQMVHVGNGVKRIVSIKERDGRTRIGIARIGEPAAN